MKSPVVLSLAVAAVCALAAAPASAQASKFGLAYRVERAPSTKLSLTACLDIAKRESAALGYAPAMENKYPGQLMVFASGPAGGGSSLVVYCIGVDQKTAFVVQAIDYLRPDSPASARAADRVHAALMAASR